MADDDRERWNQKYCRGDHASDQPSSLITSAAKFLPASGRALDVAGGAGRHALWLAELGLDVILVDVSDAGLEIARQRAEVRSLSLRILRLDLLRDELPAGPWDVILIAHYLQRPLYSRFPQLLAPAGTLIILQPTRSNLQRHSRPPAEYLLEDGELPTLLPGLSIVHYREGWLEEGRHEALLVARRL